MKVPQYLCNLCNNLIATTYRDGKVLIGGVGFETYSPIAGNTWLRVAKGDAEIHICTECILSLKRLLNPIGAVDVQEKADVGKVSGGSKRAPVQL